MRAWLGSSHPSALAELTLTDDRKRSMTGAVETAVAESRGAGTTIIVSRRLVRGFAGTSRAISGPWTSGGAKLLGLSSWFLAEHVWPDTFRAVLGGGVDMKLVAPSGAVLSAWAPPRDRASSPLANGTSTLQDRDTLWRVEVWPRDQARFYADLDRRQYLHAAMLGLMVISLVVGNVPTARTVHKKELEVSRLKSVFVSAVSHEFRSPLTGIRQLSELLVRGRVDDEERKQKTAITGHLGNRGSPPPKVPRPSENTSTSSAGPPESASAPKSVPPSDGASSIALRSSTHGPDRTGSRVLPRMA